MEKTCWIIALLLVILGMNACRSHKKTTALTDSEPEATAFHTSCYPIESLWVPSCKLEISFGKQSFSLNGSVYIRPDSVCYFRGRMIVDVIRGAIYRDSFIVINYLERVCYQGKNDYLQRFTGYPVNPESLMMLFTADQCQDVWRNRLNFFIMAGRKNQILMQGENRSLLEMHVDAQNQTIQKITMYGNQQQQPTFSAVYSEYNPFSQFVLPTVFDISAHLVENPIRIKASFREILFNQPQQVFISVPSKYEVLTF